MRNLKKHLSVLLVLAMVFTMLAPVFAASSFNYEDEAKALYGLGLYKGVSEKNFVPDLGGNLTREQSAIILLRLFGQEQEAQALTEAQVNESLARFADAGEVSSWARHQVAYAASTGVIKGIQSADGLVFNPKGALKGIDYASLVLQQLGVKDFDYFGALEKLASLNAISVPQMIAFDKEQLIRDDVVGMSYGVLTAQAENGSTVIENLIEKGLVERAYAEELGLVEKQEIPSVNPSTEPSETPSVDPSTEPTETPVEKVAKVEFVPAESRVLSKSQSLFEIGQVQITAAEEPVVVTGLKLQRTGISADTVVKSITVWNGNEKVNSIGRFSTGIANIAFTKVVTVPAGQTVKLPIKINVNNNAGVASELKISLLEVKSDTALAGNFPMMGNAFTIAEVDLGEIDAHVSGDAPVASLNAGDKDVRLAKFDFEVRSEAQTIKRIVFTQDGTAADTDLANLKLVDEDGTILALGEMNKGEVAFDLNKDCISGTTARLTIRGDVVGGAGRTILFSIDNVNDIQSVGKVYGTTIVANGFAEGNKIEIEKGAFILGKASSSPAAATVAKTVDDQKFAAIKIESIGEPIQLETLTIAVDTDGEKQVEKNGQLVTETAIREIKLVNNGVVIATQEIKKSDNVEEIELPLSEVVTVEPNSPIVVDILLDLKDAEEDAIYKVGISKITASGLVSGKDVIFPDKNADLEGVSYGNNMTVGDVKVTLEQKAQVDGYVFRNQSEEILAEFNIKHNLGETVRLSALKVKIKEEGATTDSECNEAVHKTFKNVKLVSSSGKVVSETIVNPSTAEMTIALKEGVTVEAGKTIRLGLMADIRSGAEQDQKFTFAATEASAVTIATGTTVDSQASEIDDSRVVTISAGADSESVFAKQSEEVLKDKNVVSKTNNVEIARWKLINTSREDVGVNKVYLTAIYGGQQDKDLQRAYVQCVLKDDKGTVLTDASEPVTLNKDKATEIDILKDGNRSKLVIDAANDNGDGERELILYANIADGAQIGGNIKVSLGRENDGNVDLFEVTGRVSGMTSLCTVEGEELVPSENTTTIAVSVVNANALSNNKNVTENDYGGEEGKGVKNETIGKFSIKNNGKTAVGLRQIAIRLDDQSNLGDKIEKLELYDSDGNKVTLDPVADWVEIKKNDVAKVANPNVGGISTWLDICNDAQSIIAAYNSEDTEDDTAADEKIKEAHRYVIFNIASSNIKISAGKDEVFEVRTESGQLLPTGSKVTLFVDKAHTYTDKASFDGYEICLDNEKDVNLGTVEIKQKN